jgi:hypothetical protein
VHALNNRLGGALGARRSRAGGAMGAPGAVKYSLQIDPRARKQVVRFNPATYAVSAGHRRLSR